MRVKKAFSLFFVLTSILKEISARNMNFIPVSPCLSFKTGRFACFSVIELGPGTKDLWRFEIYRNRGNGILWTKIWFSWIQKEIKSRLNKNLFNQNLFYEKFIANSNSILILSEKKRILKSFLIPFTSFPISQINIFPDSHDLNWSNLSSWSRILW